MAVSADFDEKAPSIRNRPLRLEDDSRLGDSLEYAFSRAASLERRSIEILLQVLVRTFSSQSANISHSARISISALMSLRCRNLLRFR